MQQNQQLSIIITTFNSAKIITTCLEKIDFTKHQVFVVDNASCDNTIQIVKQNFPLAQIILNPKNLGYGRGNNVALREVKTPYALILNPDAFIFEEDIQKILKMMDKHREIALGAPLLLNKYPLEENDKLQEIEVVKSNLIADCGEFLSVKYVIGATMFLRMEFYEKIGFFDENIFLYYEDDEICFRTIQNQKKCAILLESYAYHIGHGSSQKNFRIIYKRFWHRALSKFYWKEKQKGKLIAKKSAITNGLSFFLQAIFYFLILNFQRSVEKFASFMGSFAYVFDIKAFDKNNNSRG